MKYNRLIEHAPSVSEIGLGAWQLGVNSGWKNLTDREAAEMVHKSIDLGVNFFDTAPNYGYGTSESRLGSTFKNYDRDKIVINTKFGHTDLGETNYNSSYIRNSIDGSLRRLKTDYLDSLIIHNPPFEYLDGNKNDHYEILERLKDEGKIRAYGASLDSYEEIKLFVQTTGCEVLEVFFNIFHQDALRAFELAKEKKVGIIIKIPLDSGWLTGKYNENSIFKDVRSRWSLKDIKTRALLVDKLKDIIGQEVSLSQTAISFCLAYDAVSTVIPGNTSIHQLNSNLDALSNPISDELVKILERFYHDEVRKLEIPW